METPSDPDDVKPQPPAESSPNPLAELASHFEDDPFWDEMMDAIRSHRRELDAEWDNVE